MSPQIENSNWLCQRVAGSLHRSLAAAVSRRCGLRDGGVLGMDDHLNRATVLFNNCEFFRCHEVLEEAWGAEADPRRLFLQSLIHCAVGFYHHQRGNPIGAARQLRKGLDKLASYVPSAEGIDTRRLEWDVLAALSQMEAGVILTEYPQIHICAKD